MRALVYHGPGQKAWEEAADPEILDDGDVIVRVDATTICGTDLHILKGDVPAVRNGRILGHEAVGTVWEAGDGVRRFCPGDRVLVSCISACGSCQFCRETRYGQCLEGGGWVLGHKVDGTQAEFVRVLYADNSMFHIPDGVSDEEALMLADILPTGYEVGVLAGAVRPGDVVAVVGTGPVGLAAIAGARLYSPATSWPSACPTPGSMRPAVRRRRHGEQQPRRPAGRNQGPDRAARRGRVHRGRRRARLLRAGRQAGPAGRPDREHRRARRAGRAAPGGAVVRDITITTGLVDTSSTPTLMRLITTDQIDAKPFITHHFDLTTSKRPTRCSRGQPRPARSRSSSPEGSEQR